MRQLLVDVQRHSSMNSFFRFFLFLYYIIKSIVLKCIPVQFHTKKNISGQIALVTGAGGGIGRVLALRLADLGCKVVCWDVAKEGNHLQSFPNQSSFKNHLKKKKKIKWKIDDIFSR